MFKLAVFDLDGTLLDTRTGMARCGTAALAACGYPPFPRERYGAFSGGGVEDFVKGILEAAGDREFVHYDVFCRTYLQEESRVVKGDYRAFDGIEEVLGKLRGKGVKAAVLSNKGHESCLEILGETFPEGTFDLISGNVPGVPPKPDPAGANEILRRFGAKPGETIYVGDTQADMETGKNARLFTVAALWGYRTREDLEPYRPDFYAAAPRDLLELL